MLYTIEVRSAGHDIGLVMTEMLSWLDHFGCGPDSFRQSNLRPRMLSRLEFKFEREAVAFASAFGGQFFGLSH